MRPALDSWALMLALYASTFFLSLIQSGRFAPQPRHLMVSLRQVLQESPSRCSSHFFLRTRHVQQPPFPALWERGRPIDDREGVPLQLWPLSSSRRGIGSRVACRVSGEPLVDVEGEFESLGDGYVPYAMVLATEDRLSEEEEYAESTIERDGISRSLKLPSYEESVTLENRVNPQVEHRMGTRLEAWTG